MICDPDPGNAAPVQVRKSEIDMSTERRECQLCMTATELTREHVLPQWFLERWNSNDGPYTAKLNGEQVTKRDGTTERTLDHIGVIILLICKPCHLKLNELYENAATKDAVRELLDGSLALSSPAAVELVAKWMVKTLALSRHPASRHEINVGKRYGDARPIGAWNPLPETYAPNILSGRVPPETSLWLAVADNDTGVDDPSFIVPGRCVDAVCTLGFNTTRGQAFFQLVHHPGILPTHPFAADNLVVQLWPDPPPVLDLSAITAVRRNTRLGSVFTVFGSTDPCDPPVQK